MSTRDFIELTLFVYRLTDKWDHSNPIRFKIRREAAEALEAFVSGKDQIQDVIATLSWARKEKMIDRNEFTYLRDSYEEANISSPQKKASKKRTKPNLKKRERKIVKILGEEREAQVGDLKESFPDISKRTLRRDLDGLLEKGIIVRNGEWNDVYYTLVQ